MEKSIGLGVFGTFGNPNGYQQSFFLNGTFPQNLDLNPNAIELLPNSKLYLVRKDYNGGVHSLCFCVYSYAKEFQSNRRGTFIGNCVVFNDFIAEGGYIFDCLKEIHSDTINNPVNFANNMLQVQDVRNVIVAEPISFSALLANSTKIEYKPQLPDNSKSYFIAANNLTGEDLDKVIKLFFTKSISDFPQVGSMYFSANQQVIDYVRAKGLIPVADWSEFKNYSKQPVQQPKQNQKQQKKKGEIQINQQAAQEGNSERFKPYEPIFNDWKMPSFPWDIHEISRKVQEHNMIIRQYEKLEDELYKLKSSIEEEGLTDKFAFFLNKNKLPIILSIMLLLGTFVAYVWFFVEPEPKKVVVLQPVTEQPQIQVIPKLNPEPNDRLRERDIKTLSGKGLKGKTIQDVLATIYKLNPTDIGQYYVGQEQLYEKLLRELNPECFKPYNNHIVCFCGKLQNVPTYKNK